jgi:hypothetical protein
MKLGIMQPYFFPYVGYFQLIAAVDVFIIYDNIKYTKKGWINRNRILVDGSDLMVSLPLKSGSDSLDIGQRTVSEDYDPEKLLRKIRAAYRTAPYFAQTFPLLERSFLHDDRNLFSFLRHCILCACEFLGIKTEIRTSSHVTVDHSLKSQEKVLALCEECGADLYINAIGGAELYSKQEFLERGIALKFLRSRPFTYTQFANEFVPSLSIIDVMMFNSRDVVLERIENGYDFV